MAEQHLNHIVTLNEGIKSIVRAAFNINLLAINAILVAKKLGDAVSGFRVISSELRGLTDQLKHSMARLVQNSHELVVLTSTLLKDGRILHAFNLTKNKYPELPFIDQTLSQINSKFDSHQQTLRKTVHDLASELSDAHRICLFGSIISKSAKIEAAYTDTENRALANVSQLFADEIALILPTIEDLSRSLRNIS